ncbi:hypothetical protein FLONG3_9837 [Fusarium longipes]|uniref:Uncharacterized protein n=1 Tax=Fusarium longipes TaxID=694270 RepID=A0A395RUF2_9HYPO|nr:hypothetical protein FLONG3_9837 [Fusarium longipes]
MRSPQSRPCHPDGPYGPQGGERRAEAFFTMLQTLHVEKPDRFEYVAKRIKHLCTDVNPQWLPRTENYETIYPDAIRVWELLPYMTELESLELRGNCFYGRDEEDPVHELRGPTPQLRFAKLSGYIPRALPAWVLKAGNTLERLELGMLDRPISTNMSSHPEQIPLPHERLRAQKGHENTEAESDVDSDGEDEDNGNEDDDDGSDWGSLGGEAVIPRPLGGCLSSYQDNELKLPKIKHLYLGQPSESSYFDSVLEYSWSKRAEKACYSDWRKIIQASIPTLSTLVLEQRPAADYIENDGISEEEWMENNTTPSASRNLIKMVLKVLETDKSQGSLQHVYLYGIFVSILDDGMPDPEETSGQLMQLLQGCGVECEARVGQWCFFDRNPGRAMWGDWYGDDESEDEMEAGDETMKWDDLWCRV